MPDGPPLRLHLKLDMNTRFSNLSPYARFDAVEWLSTLQDQGHAASRANAPCNAPPIPYPSNLYTLKERAFPDRRILNASGTNRTQSRFRDRDPHASFFAINRVLGRGVLRARVVEESLEAECGGEGRAVVFGDGNVHACEWRAKGVGLGAFRENVADHCYGWSGGSAGMESKGCGEG